MAEQRVFRGLWKDHISEARTTCILQTQVTPSALGQEPPKSEEVASPSDSLSNESRPGNRRRWGGVRLERRAGASCADAAGGKSRAKQETAE